MPDAEFYAAIADVKAAHRRLEALCSATNNCLSRAEIKRTQSIAAELERARANMLLNLGPNTTEGALALVRLMFGDVHLFGDRDCLIAALKSLEKFLYKRAGTAA